MINDTALRFLSIDMVNKANSGHPGLPMGMATVLSVLYSKYLKFYAKDPKWYDRDRFVLSGGHGSALLYALLYMTGYPDIALEDLKEFRQLGSKTAGHPERELLSGVEISTGPLGQGIANAVGMAIAERHMHAKFGDIIDHRTFVSVGDGDLMEGISEEAISLAGHLNLNKLTVLWDDNGITIDGKTSITTSTDMKKRFEANGWKVTSCDGHNVLSIQEALDFAMSSEKPTLVICKTVIGFGSVNKAGSSSVHGSPLGQEERQKTAENLNWPYAPFEIPQEILQESRAVGLRHEQAYKAWCQQKASHPMNKDLEAWISGQLPVDFEEKLRQWTNDFNVAHPEALASRKSSAYVLEYINHLIPNLMSGSADLSGSCFTKTKDMDAFTKEDYRGNYINYGIREHAMGAIMNGISAHGGLIPLSSTFFSFVDYMKPSVRLSALMGLHSIYVLTHDSIGVGEDGPTHQPIEQLISLRSIPNMYVFRPCDMTEVSESYACALSIQNAPSALVLSRQNLPLLRPSQEENKTRFGGYVIKEAENPDITLIATGSEVSLALEASKVLEDQEGIHASVVSMPCCELFDKQPQAYKTSVLGEKPCLALEMASTLGWYKYVGFKGDVLGIDTFGASGPAQELMKKYNFTIQGVIEKVKDILKKNT